MRVRQKLRTPRALWSSRGNARQGIASRSLSECPVMVARFRVPRTRPLPGASRPTPYIVERKVVRYVRLRACLARMVKILIGYVLIVIHYHNRLGLLFSCYQGASRAGMRGTDTSFSRTSRAASLSGLYDKHRSSLNAT